MSKRLFTPAEVADLLDMHRRSVYRKLRSGSLNGHKLPDEDKWRITRSDLEDYLGPDLAAELLPNDDS